MFFLYEHEQNWYVRLAIDTDVFTLMFHLCNCKKVALKYLARAYEPMLYAVYVLSIGSIMIVSGKIYLDGRKWSVLILLSSHSLSSLVLILLILSQNCQTSGDFLLFLFFNYVQLEWYRSLREINYSETSPPGHRAKVNRHKAFKRHPRHLL